MNLGELGLHEDLLGALEKEGLGALYPFLETTVEHVNLRKESISAQVRLGYGRESTYIVPLLQWLLTEGAEGRALVIVPTEQDVAAAQTHALALAETVGISVHTIGRDPDTMDDSARFSIAAAEVLADRQDEGTLDLKGYAFIVVDGAERFVESPHYSHIRRLRAYLLPAWERRTIVFSEKLGIKEQTLALDLTDAPTEIYLEEETEKAKHVPQATWYVTSEAKMRLLLGVLSREKLAPVAVFCNLREGAEETARRLAINGRRVEYILGNLPRSRKDAIQERARSGEIEIVVLTDEGAKDFVPGSFPLVINYDIPLEGEPYLGRVCFLDSAVEGAHVINLACDRYVYGIPAVEQFMGISLGAIQADETFFAREDKSAGMVFGRRDQSKGMNGSRGNRRDWPSGQAGGGAQRRESSGYRRGARDQSREGNPRNQESIRAGIAELTGVNLGGSGARSHSSEGSPPREAREHGQRSADSRQGGRGGHHGGKHGRKGAAHSGAVSVKAAAPGTPLQDPYAISMEERMRIYKEKYGKQLTESVPSRSPGKKKKGHHRGASQGPHAPRPRPEARDSLLGERTPPPSFEPTMDTDDKKAINKDEAHGIGHSSGSSAGE